MKKSLIIIAMISLCSIGYSQQKMKEIPGQVPSEDELLDFGNVDEEAPGGSPPNAPPPTTQGTPPPLPPLPQEAPQAAPKAKPQVAKPSRSPAPTPAPPPPPPPEEMPAPVPTPEVAAPSEEAPPPPPEELPAPPPSTAETAPEEPSGPTESGEISKADKRREERFARIYRKFNHTEIGDEEWNKIAGDKGSESYGLQQGDTLWDLSSKFFGNGFYWPKVWQLNDTITNPHLVRVGNTLRFSPGTATAPPALSVEETGEQRFTEENEKVDTETVTTYESSPDQPEGLVTTDQIVIPPPRKRTPVLRNIPPSFPAWSEPTGNYDSDGFSLDVTNKKNASVASAVTSIISDDEWNPVGKIVEMEGGTETASTYQNIIVDLEKEAQNGEKFTVFSNNKDVEDPITGDTAGVEIVTKAEIEILSPVEGTSTMYRALVKFTTAPVVIGDSLMEGQKISRTEFSTTGPASNVTARVLQPDDPRREIFGLHHTVFLNRGEEDGVQAGSLLSVLKNYQLRHKDSVMKFDPVPIGTLKVVNVGRHVATAVVVSERDAIWPGDETAVASAPSKPEPGAEPGAGVDLGTSSESSPDSGSSSDAVPSEAPPADLPSDF